jgi:hypothetical protein
MPLLYGRNFTKHELLKRGGMISQFGGVKRYTLSEGREKGVDAVEARTGSGFMFRVLPGRGMDISRAEFRGAPLAWLSPTGESAPEYFEPGGVGWLRNFFGGLVTTCGLRSIGRPSVDGDEALGLHGRISNIRAEQVSAGGMWEGDDYLMTISGKVAESKVFGENITLERHITAKLGSSCLKIHDTVLNEGFRTEPHMMLYHVNAGFPVLDRGSKLVSASKSVVPRGEEASREAALYPEFSSPGKNYRERVYYHEIALDENGFASAAVVNKGFDNGRGLGLYIKYNAVELPFFFEWKMNGEGIYAAGMEPANALGEGRAVERAEGRLKFLEPGEKKDYFLEIGVLSSAEEIDSFEKDAGRLAVT